MSVDAFTARAWLEYGREYARYPSLWDSSLAFSSGPLMPEAATLRDYSGRTAGATWSVGAGDVPKYVQGSVRGQAFWASYYDGSNDCIQNNSTQTAAFSTENWSMSWWVILRSLSGSQTIMPTRRTDDGASQQDVLTSYWSTNTTTFQAIVNKLKNAQYSVAWTPVVNQWYHWCVQRDSALIRFWIDGIEQHATESVAAGTNDFTFSKAGAILTSGRYGNYAGLYLVGSDCGTHVVGRKLTSSEISILSQHPLAAFETVRPKYWMFTTTAAASPWLYHRRSARIIGGGIA